MDQASIGVVIPTFDRLELLRQTVRSVRGQRRAADRIVVVDDGSSDGTAEWLAGQEDVTVVRNPDGGWGPARGRDAGAAAVGTDLIAFLDSDDLLLPNALADLAATLAARPAAPFAFGRSLVACRGADGWRPRGLITPEPAELADLLPALFARNFVSSVGTLLRRSAFERIGGYPHGVTFAEDHYFWIRLAQLGEPAFAPVLTAVYRVHGGNRHTPADAERESGAFLRLAAEDPRLADAVAGRLGVQLTENATVCLPGHPLAGLRTLRTALAGGAEKAAVLRAAGRYWRGRRRRDAAGLSLWRARPELRSFLAAY
jgi:glycosyltransferase involved in cell wall biosynthesis